MRKWPNSTIFQHLNLPLNVLDRRDFQRDLRMELFLRPLASEMTLTTIKLTCTILSLIHFYELKRRFTDKNKDIMRALQACCPTSRNFLDTSHLQPLITTYNLDREALNLETQVAKRTLARKELEDISDVLMELAPLKLAFPTAVKLLQIAMTICQHC